MITLAVIVAVAAVAGIYVTRKADCACGVCRIAFLLHRSRQPRQTVAGIQAASHIRRNR